MMQRLTIEVPEDVYRRLVERARRLNRSVRAEILDAIAGVIQDETGLTPEIEAELAAMADANDEQLWSFGRTRLPDEVIEEIEDLRMKSSAGGLTREEEDRLAGLVLETDRVMLVRAEAAALLKQRGHDVQVLLRS
jgi:predicted transcriptional regulator